MRYSFLRDPAVRFAGSNKLADIGQRSLRLQATAESATRLRGKLHELRHSPPRLTAQDPRLWWEKLPSPGLSSSVTELEWNKAMKSLADMLILLPLALGGIRLDLLQIISDDPRIAPRIGEIWRAQGAVSRGPAYHARTDPSWRVVYTWGA